MLTSLSFYIKSSIREVKWLAKVKQLATKIIRKISITLQPILSLLYEQPLIFLRPRKLSN